MSDPCCDNPTWTTTADLVHLIGEFKEKHVEGMLLRRCESCSAFRLDVRAPKGRAYRIPISNKVGEEIRETDIVFWKALRNWARS